ncbi:MAG: NAD(P)H-dependent oxidoreductase [Pseudomonadota bacterium]
MAKVLVCYAHPGHRFSTANAELWRAAQEVEGITRTDLYAAYPRFNIDIDREQAQLVEHDVLVLQYPLFWYATPALIKEWLDLVLEHGFAYGTGGTALAGKTLQIALTAAGPEDAYTPDGYQHFPLRTFLTPMEQTASLCKMRFLPPYALFGALKAPTDGRLAAHAAGYRRLLEGLRDETLDPIAAAAHPYLTADTLPLPVET